MVKRRTTATETIKLGSYHVPCPKCGKRLAKHSTRTRQLIDVEGVWTLEFPYHRCRDCNHNFMDPAARLMFWGKSGYSREFVKLALNLLKGHTLVQASERLKALTGVSVRESTIHDWAKMKAGL